MEEYFVYVDWIRTPRPCNLDVEISKPRVFPLSYPKDKVDRKTTEKGGVTLLDNHALAIRCKNKNLKKQSLHQYLLVFSRFMKVGLDCSFGKEESAYLSLCIFSVSNLQSISEIQRILGEDTNFGINWKKEPRSEVSKMMFPEDTFETPWWLEQVFVREDYKGESEFQSFVIEQYVHKPLVIPPSERKLRESNKYHCFEGQENLDRLETEEDDRPERLIEYEAHSNGLKECLIDTQLNVAEPDEDDSDEDSEPDDAEQDEDYQPEDSQLEDSQQDNISQQNSKRSLEQNEENEDDNYEVEPSMYKKRNILEE
jgi:hypothetical protein